MNVAARYARALFTLAGDAAARQEKLAVISTACTSPQALAFWQHPGVELSARQELAAAVVTGVDANDKQLHNFLLLLVEQQRVPLLPAITALHAELVKRQAGIVEVSVTSSHPLQVAQQEEINQTMADYLQKKINIAFSVDTSILGGIVVSWEHRVWDFSLSTKLQAMIKHVVW